jgi:hypothetical protein
VLWFKNTDVAFKVTLAKPINLSGSFLVLYAQVYCIQCAFLVPAFIDKLCKTELKRKHPLSKNNNQLLEYKDTILWPDDR